MSELAPEEFDYSDYDLEEMVTPVEPQDALPYPPARHEDGVEEPVVRAFVSSLGVSPSEAIATARLWSNQRRWCGVGACLMTVRQYYGVSSKYGTAALSWAAADHKHFVQHGADVPRGAPVWWTGGSEGAGHIAISIGGGLCLSTDWKEPGRIDVARIDDITTRWNLTFRGYTNEVNDVFVWKPSVPVGTVNIKNLKPGAKNRDVLELKKRLKAKGYKGFILKSNKFGLGTKRAYKKYQEHLGFKGSDADGVPGVVTLKKLGFVVK